MTESITRYLSHLYEHYGLAVSVHFRAERLSTLPHDIFLSLWHGPLRGIQAEQNRWYTKYHIRQRSQPYCVKLFSGIVPDKVTFFLHSEDLHIDFIAADFGYDTVSDFEFIHFNFSYAWRHW
jgi:hypothetical protein